MPAPTALPIWKIQPEILRTLQEGNRLVLVAPTGSGKTTQVPQMLLDGGLAGGGGKMIVVLQPRRVAARTVAARVASERGGKLGAEVGYQIRLDDHTSAGTRICFVTEGILLRWLQDDLTLSYIGAVIFDEFHERNLLSDVALALVKQLQQTTRPDLAMVVMSATLDAEPVAAYLDSCPILISEGQSFPVEVHYLPLPDQRPSAMQAAEAVERILASGEPGDILVFMPGRGEINATLDALRGLRSRERVACLPLHGELDPHEQDHAFSPNPLRKIIVATNVAETSITIDGIRHVVDSGTARVARYDGERGIGTLLLEPISRASADQRKGRAGRTAPGTCHRLWTALSHKNRDERNTPEIQRTDLAEVVLLLHSFGIREAATFAWLDPPDSTSVARAEHLLTMLGALEDGRLTPLGHQMLRLPMHPRYSRMLLEASPRGCVPAVALCAALVSGRDLLTRVDRSEDRAHGTRDLFEDSPHSDFVTLMRAYEFAKDCGFHFDRCRAHGINAQVARQVEQTYQQILHATGQQRLHDRHVPLAPPDKNDESLRRCLMAGYIDQLAKRRSPGSTACDLTGQRHGQLARESVVQDATFFTAVNLRDLPARGPDSIVLLSLATAVEPGWIRDMFPQQLTTSLEHHFDAKNKRVAALLLVRYHDLILEQNPQQRDLDPAASGRCLAESWQNGAFDLPLFDHRLKQFIARVNLVHTTLPELEFNPLDEPAIASCLARAFHGLILAKDAQAAPLTNAFHQHLEKGQLSWLDELAPLTLPGPDNTTLKISYTTGEPHTQLKLQDCFTLKTHPTLCEGRLPVHLTLTTPDQKPLTTTHDLPTFLTREWPKHRPTLTKKFPGHLWR